MKPANPSQKILFRRETRIVLPAAGPEGAGKPCCGVPDIFAAGFCGLRFVKEIFGNSGDNHAFQ